MAEQIPVTNLVKGKWYVGRGRNGNVGLWDGIHFLVIAEKFDDYVIKHEPYYEENWGCFQPFVLVDEGEMAEPFGRLIWDKHYGRRVEFGGQEEIKKRNELIKSELVGGWKASAYMDRTRIDCTLRLSADGTFEHRHARSPSAVEHLEEGTWHYDEANYFLHLNGHTPDAELRKTCWCILGFTGATLLLQWHAFAARNMPFLYYRVELDLATNQNP